MARARQRRACLNWETWISMTDLEMATTDELVDELRRRSDGGIVIVHMPGPDGSMIEAGKSWGNHSWRIGTCRVIERQLMAETMAEYRHRDRLTDEDEENDD